MRYDIDNNYWKLFTVKEMLRNPASSSSATSSAAGRMKMPSLTQLVPSASSSQTASVTHLHKDHANLNIQTQKGAPVMDVVNNKSPVELPVSQKPPEVGRAYQMDSIN